MLAPLGTAHFGARDARRPASDATQPGFDDFFSFSSRLAGLIERRFRFPRKTRTREIAIDYNIRSRTRNYSTIDEL